MRIIKCDRCGKELLWNDTDNIGHIALRWKDIRNGELVGLNPYEDVEFCDDCMKDISDFIENKPTIVDIQLPEDDPVTNKIDETLGPVPKPKKKSQPKKIDKGKVKALHDAGWPASKIADEMKVTVQTINYHLNKMRHDGGDADDRSGEGEA